MQSKTTTVKKEYTSAFVLDNTKLSRMLSILSERFSNLQLQMNAEYTVYLSNDKKIEITSLEQLFNLDNTVRNPIRSLMIYASNSSDQHMIKSHIKYSNAEDDNVSINVESDDANFTFRLFTELEEQAQRTFLNNWIYRFLKHRFWFFWLLMLLLSFTMLMPSIFRTKTSTFTAQTTNELLTQSSEAITTDQKIDFLFDLQVQELKLFAENQSSATIYIPDIFNIRTIFIMLPVLVMLACASYAIFYCYPGKVFEWGDYKEHYARLVSVRNTLWIVVILSMVLGVLSNLFVIGFSSFVKIG